MNVKSHQDTKGSAQDGSNSSALAMELLQSCAKPSIQCCTYVFDFLGVKIYS